MTRQEKAIQLMSVLLGLAMLASALLAMPHGFDITDEGFYLNWIANPWSYATSATQFGFFYHPLYRLLDADIVLLRQVNLLFTFGCAWLLCARIVPSRALAFILATTSLAFLQLWLPTPSYNSLAFQGLLLAMAGWCGTGARRILLLGIGAWMLAMAKPPGAVMLGVLLLLICLCTRRSLRPLLAAGMVAALLMGISILLMDGSFTSFAERLRGSIHDMHLLYGDHLQSIWRLDSFTFDKAGWLIFAGITLLVLVSMQVPMLAGFHAPLAIVAALLVLGGVLVPGPLQPHAGMWLAAPMIAALLMGLRHRSQWPLAILFLLLPHLFAFGTTNNYWQMGQMVALFWVLAGASVLAANRSAALVPLAVAAQLITVVLLAASMQFPYRQDAPIAEQDMEVAIRDTPLQLDEKRAEIITGLQLLARDHGMQPLQPMIDLSGRAPGLVYALGAQSVPTAWSLGGYPGSEAWFAAKLAQMDAATRAKSWVLGEPNDPRALPMRLLGDVPLEKMGEVKGWQLYRPRGDAGE